MYNKTYNLDADSENDSEEENSESDSEPESVYNNEYDDDCESFVSAMSEIRDFEDFGDSWDEPLYEGSSLTVAESLMAIFTFTLRHKITNVCLGDMLQLIYIHCVSHANKCVKSLYKFWKLLEKFKSPVERIFFCAKCGLKYENDKNPCKCKDAEKCFFLRLPITDQLQKCIKDHHL